MMGEIMLGIVISNHGAEPKTEQMMKEQFNVDEVLYLKHPEIDPGHDKERVWDDARGFLKTNIPERLGKPAVAIVNGEYGFSTACVHYLEDVGVPCYYPTSRRGATEEVLPDGSIKTTHVYVFIRFRRW